MLFGKHNNAFYYSKVKVIRQNRPIVLYPDVVHDNVVSNHVTIA